MIGSLDAVAQGCQLGDLVRDVVHLGSNLVNTDAASAVDG